VFHGWPVAKDIWCIPKLAEARRLVLAHNVVPVTHTFISDLETPVSAFLKLAPQARVFLLESAEQGQRCGRYSFLGIGARAVVSYRAGVLTVEENGERREMAHDDPFAAAAELLGAHDPAPTGDVPSLAGALVGYFGYDLVRHLERLPLPPPDDLGLPEMAFLLPDTVLVFDHLKHTVTIVANAVADGSGIDGPYRRAVATIATLKARLGGPLPAGATARSAGLSRPPELAAACPVASSMTREAFEAGVSRIRDYVVAGDALQVVLSQRFSRPIDVSPFAVYRGLRAVNPSPYMYYMAFDDFALAGSSPEPLVTVSGDRVTTRPIAGTRRRGRDAAQDARLADELRADEKERAEHVMLVDLGRNDLGRVCRPGSVSVDELMGVELYSHVMHMVSSVSGRLAPGRDALDALKAAFPAGTVSGAPKVRAMEIIRELEPEARGPYAGAIGYLSPGGELDTCICIRTIVMKDGVAYAQAGAGIVADSDPAGEFVETQNKAAALLRAVALAHEEFA
jgi:anthranilate synthase component I